MGFCYLCELDKKNEAVDLICAACMKSYECEKHGQEGVADCWICRERLRDVIHASTIAVKRQRRDEEKNSIVSNSPKEFGLDY